MGEVEWMDELCTRLCMMSEYNGVDVDVKCAKCAKCRYCVLCIVYCVLC